MIATTRSACRTPSSISRASSLASETEWIGTLRTSMAEGMGCLSLLVGYDDGAGVAGDGVEDVVQGGDHRVAATALDKAAGSVHLRPHGAAGEVALGGKGA